MTKIAQTTFYDQYGTNKVALLERGQTVEIEKFVGLPASRSRRFYYLCKVVNPSDASKNYGAYEGMLVKVHEEDLDMQT